MQAVPLASDIFEVSKPLKMLLARGTRPIKKINVDVFSKKSDLKECKANLECKKVKYKKKKGNTTAKGTYNCVSYYFFFLISSGTILFGRHLFHFCC